MLAQPAFGEEAATAKSEFVQELAGKLGAENDEPPDEPMDDRDKLALLEMAGRMPIRIVKPDGSISY